MGTSTYLIAIGSNRRTKWGSPKATLLSFLRDFAASREIAGLARRREGAKEDGRLIAHSRIVENRPLGPGKRHYANAVAVIESERLPPKMLKALKRIERAYGRRSGRRWGDRPLDLDIIQWSGGMWVSPELTIPHPAFRMRRFVLVPLVEIAPLWRDPVTHLTARHLLARLDRKRPHA